MGALVAVMVLAGTLAAKAPSAGSARPQPLALGKAFTFHQAPDAVKATALRVIDPARAVPVRARSGSRFVAVRVVLRNVGSRALYAGSSNCTRLGAAALLDSKGGRRATRKGLAPDLASFFAAKSNPYVETSSLPAGASVTGYYTFEVPSGARPVLFTLTPCRAAATARWRLR